MLQNTIFLSPYQHTSINIKSSLSVIKSSNSEKILGITIDSDFAFGEHINMLCRKASQKLHALSRISQYLSQHKKRILFKTFIMSQFNYCPLVWMRHRRGLNNNINNTHKRTLRYTIHFLSRQKIIHYTLFIKTKNQIYRIYYRRTNLCLST